MKTRPAIPAAIRRRKPTLTGLAPCANAPVIRESRTGYSTVTHRSAAKTREALRTDDLRRKT